MDGWMNVTLKERLYSYISTHIYLGMIELHADFLFFFFSNGKTSTIIPPESRSIPLSSSNPFLLVILISLSKASHSLFRFVFDTDIQCPFTSVSHLAKDKKKRKRERERTQS